MKPKKKTQSRNKTLGNKGEDIASQFLQKKGYHLITRNFRAKYGEIDILMVYKQTLVAIEVKTRRNMTYGFPEEAVTQKKIRDLSRALQYFVVQHPQFQSFSLRIDVVSVLLDHKNTLCSLKHIKNIAEF